MDAAGPQEVDVPYDPLDVVEHVLNAENLFRARQMSESWDDDAPMCRKAA